MKTMTGLDAAFLYFETPTSPMHVVGVLVLEPLNGQKPPGVPEITSVLAERLHLIPPFRRRIVKAPVSIDHPVWVEDPDFDLSYHIKPSPLKGNVSWTELEEYVGEVSSWLLDRDHPLWEMWVVNGLEGDRVALVTKLHHSIMDGSAGGDLMASMFDLEPHAKSPVPPVTPWQPDAIPSAQALTAQSVVSLARRQGELPGAARRLLGNAYATVQTLRAQHADGTATQMIAQRTAVNGLLTARRSVSLTTVDLDKVREIRRTFGTTINDVVLAATATAMRDYLVQRGTTPPASLVVAAPVNVRMDAPGSRELGNQVSNMMVELPLQPDDPVERLQAVHEMAKASKAVQSAFGPETLQQLTALAAPPLMTALAHAYTMFGLARLHRPIYNLIVSNVPGPPIDLYIAGARVTGVFPMGPLLDGSGLNLTVLSEAHRLNVGIMACPNLVPDVGKIGEGFVEAVEELHRFASKVRPTTP